VGGPLVEEEGWEERGRKVLIYAVDKTVYIYAINKTVNP